MAAETGGQLYESKVIAQLFGVSVRRIQQLTQDGVLETVHISGQRNKYDLIPTIQAYIKYLSDKAYGKNRSEKELELREQKLQADIALKESQGELHQIKTKIAAGTYVDIDDVKRDYSNFFTVFKRFALSLPGKISNEVIGYVGPTEARRIEKDLQGEILRQLGAFVVAGVTELPQKNASKK